MKVSNFIEEEEEIIIRDAFEETIEFCEEVQEKTNDGDLEKRIKDVIEHTKESEEILFNGEDNALKPFQRVRGIEYKIAQAQKEAKNSLRTLEQIDLSEQRNNPVESIRTAYNEIRAVLNRAHERVEQEFGYGDSS